MTQQLKKKRLLPIKMKNVQIFINKPFHLKISKIKMYEFWYD